MDPSSSAAAGEEWVGGSAFSGICQYWEQVRQFISGKRPQTVDLRCPKTRPSSFQPWMSPVFHFIKLSDFITNLNAIFLEASLCGWYFFPLPVLKSTLNNGPWSYPFLHSSDLQYHSNIQRRAGRVSSPGDRGDWSRRGRTTSGSGDSQCRNFPMKRLWNQNWERGGEKKRVIKCWRFNLASYEKKKTKTGFLGRN